MKRDLEANHAGAGPAQRSSMEPGDAGPQSGAPGSLDALSAASDKFRHTEPPHAGTRRRSTLAPALLCGLVIGAAVFLYQAPQHRCEALLQADVRTEASVTQDFVARLADFAHRKATASDGDSRVPLRWFVNQRDDGVVRLSNISADSISGVAQVRLIAESFLELEAERAENVRATPTAPEQLLTNMSTVFGNRLTAASALARGEAEGVPSQDPTANTKELMARWELAHADFLHRRQRLNRVVAALKELDNKPVPSEGIVAVERQKKAYQASDALQQDLRELFVNLSLLRSQLLKVGRDAAESLQELLRASAGKAEQTPDTGSAAFRHGELLANFASNWKNEFSALESMEIDPQRSDLLSIHARLRTSLNNYLYQSARQLAEIRAGLESLEEESSDQTRHHVLSSQRKRDYHRLRQARDRFEFRAGQLETPANFRLDAALQSARGLSRRTRQRSAAIDQRLAALALEEARTKHKTDRTALVKDVERLRFAADQAVESLFSIQQAINTNAGASEVFLRKTLAAKVAEARLDVLQMDADGAAQRLELLGRQRLSDPATTPVKLVSCGVGEANMNLVERLTAGGVAGTIAFLMFLGGQWWTPRRT